MMRTDSIIDWNVLLADDGSLPFIPHVITHDEVSAPVVIAPVPKRSAVAPRPRKRADDGIVVGEHPDTGVSGILNCSLYVETRWTCVCGASFRKPGRHNGSLRTCRSCRAKFFLRMVPVR